ncbi:FAD:protein FMN transferase [Undibacterium sp. SXout7W]|uniref:FAD:protein FMN transferase n=1 Tax=Undibacterium sp. SXout7W TaxID=3413049 RepID=UPI003BF223B4
MKRRTFIATGLGLTSVCAAGLPYLSHLSPRPDTQKKLTEQAAVTSGAALAFGTTISIDVIHSDQPLARTAISAALAAAQEIDRLMSLHSEHSQVTQLNRHAYLNAAHPHLLKVLTSAAELSALSDGAFDITVQPLWLSYQEAAAHQTLPSDDERHRAMGLVDWRQISLNGNAVKFNRPGMSVTLNGIAQGYAVDVARQVLLEHGITHALLDTGEFSARGNKLNHQAWSVGIRDPRNTQALTGVAPLLGRSLATSGDYETSFTPDFAHHHIFDPGSGDSPTELASVSVIADTGLLADGLSTAMMVLGVEKSLSLAARLEGVDVLLIGKNGKQWQSPAFPLQVHQTI